MAASDVIAMRPTVRLACLYPTSLVRPVHGAAAEVDLRVIATGYSPWKHAD